MHSFESRWRSRCVCVFLAYISLHSVITYLIRISPNVYTLIKRDRAQLELSQEDETVGGIAAALAANRNGSYQSTTSPSIARSLSSPDELLDSPPPLPPSEIQQQQRRSTTTKQQQQQHFICSSTTNRATNNNLASRSSLHRVQVRCTLCSGKNDNYWIDGRHIYILGFL